MLGPRSRWTCIRSINLEGPLKSGKPWAKLMARVFYASRIVVTKMLSVMEEKRCAHAVIVFAVGLADDVF